MSEPVSARALPRGFRFASASAGLKKKGHTGSLDVALIVSDPPASAAAVFTQNLVQAPPVVLSREHVRGSAGAMRAVIVNSGNANCSVGPGGMAASRATADCVAELLGCSARQVVVCSTGVIGVPLPVERILKAAPGLAKSLAFSARAFDGLNRAIMTTDTRPKRAAASARIGGKTVRVAGCAKGAGMIHPNMATMLSFVVTDAAVDPGVLDVALREVVNRTFNCITVDGDSSTNDTLLVLANGASGAKKITELGGADYAKFVAALEEVCKSLAIGIVEDGEGATHLVEIEVRGAPSDAAAKRVAETIGLSSLVKTAVAGADPNWGRILAAAGRSGVAFNPDHAEIWLGGMKMYGPPKGESYSVALPLDERAAHRRLLDHKVPIAIDLHGGDGSARVWTCDLTKEYVHINASYRT
ncbi:MAG TPA: bifunctional glutamate N-acetyltransferase/amino-acid acetyltransferase ArgJ [Verrucomicrobiae bacterium]|jgi:glutamate N-acetyltransferase/amino-acid N-acetyltransferase|nr:bifunctional glutamate N-acetyltransferase/amino-acid acetyltransferase ArgJ [Verrucomicrobiae bacterium]